MPFPPRLVFLVFAFACFVIAAVMDWPFEPARRTYGHTLGWLGGAFMVAALAAG